MEIRPVRAASEGDSIVFAGDYVGSDFYDSPPVDSTLRWVIDSAEAAFVNFEAPVDTGTPTQKFGPTLGQGEHEAVAISEMGFDAVTLANNHIMDHGMDGLAATLEYCEEAGLETVGAGVDVSSAIEPVHLSIGDVDVAVFNACEKEFGIAGESVPGAVWIGEREFERAVVAGIEDFDSVIVVAHGGIEYVPLPPPSWQRRLRRFAELGVDAVIAHHPHVALPWEVHEGVPIFYSLGNFVFHDSSRPETAWTYLLDVEVAEGENPNVGVRLVEVCDGKVRMMSDKKQDDYWEHLTGLSELIERSASEPGYWQEVATRIYGDRYHGRIDDYGNGRVLSSIRNPIYEVDRITRGIVSDNERRRTQRLAVLNYVSSDCHRDVIETALKVNTGIGKDHRTTEIEKAIDQYFGQVNTKHDWSTTKRAKWYIGKGLERIYSR